MSKTTTEEVESIVVSPKTLEKVFKLKERQIRYLAEDGILTKASRGKYKFTESVTNYIAHLKANKELKNPDKDKEKKVDYDEQKAKHELAKRLRTEMQLAKMENKLHDSEDVEAVMADMLYKFRAKMLAIPSKLAPGLANEHDIVEISKILKDTIHSALIELADYNPEMFIEEDQSFEEEDD